jgi:hypothetical protein
MSFDLKIESNDLKIENNGSISVVENEKKLGQEVIKGILTPVGSNRFFRWYGSTISTKTVGHVLDASMIESEIQRSVENMLNNLISLQKAQSRTQYVSPGESIASIKEISVFRNKTDPRQYEVVVRVITRQLTETTEVFELRV